MSLPVASEPASSALIRALIPLGFVTALTGLVNAFVTPFLPLFLSHTLHVGPFHMAFFLFLTPLATVAVATMVGRVSDRPAMRQRVLVAAAVAGGVAFALHAALRDYWLLLAVSVTLVAFAGSLLPQAYAYGREVLDQGSPAHRAMGLSSLRMLLSLAWVAGPALGALLVATVDFRGLFLATALGYLLILILLGLLRRPARPAAGPAAGAPARPEGDRASLATLVRTGVSLVLLQSAVVLGVLSMPLLMSEDLHRSVRDAGLVIGLCAAIEIPLMLFFAALATRWPARRLMILGSGFGVAYYAVVAVSGGVWMVVTAQVLNACFISSVTGLGITYVQDLMPGSPGQGSTLYTNSGRASAMVAGLVFGLMRPWGNRLPYAVCVVLCLAGLILLARSPVIVSTSVGND